MMYFLVPQNAAQQICVAVDDEWRKKQSQVGELDSPLLAPLVAKTGSGSLQVYISSQSTAAGYPLA
jgi:hypothetical protein